MFSCEMTTRLPKEIVRGQRLDSRAVVIACPPLLFVGPGSMSINGGTHTICLTI